MELRAWSCHINEMLGVPTARKASEGLPSEPSPSPDTRGSGWTRSGRGFDSQDGSQASNPSWSSLTSPAFCTMRRSYAQGLVKSRETPQHLVVPADENARCCVSIRLCMKLTELSTAELDVDFQPWFHRLSAVSRQVIRRVLHSLDRVISLENPRLSRRICNWFSLH